METANRKYVIYEIEESFKLGNGLLGVYIHRAKNILGKTSIKGANPFSKLYISKAGKKIYLTDLYSTYDWVNNDGYNKFGDWVEKAAKQAGK